MNSNMKYLKLFIATLFIALISCSKDDVSKSDKVEDTKSVLLKISNMPITYSEGQPQVAAPISFTSGNIKSAKSL